VGIDSGCSERRVEGTLSGHKSYSIIFKPFETNLSSNYE